MSERKQIVLFVITTRKYKKFFPTLLAGVDKYFLVNHDITIELFTDEILPYEETGRVKINQTLIEPYKFPYVSLYRYKFFTSKTYNCDFMYYTDADMGFVDYIGEEIFGDIVAVRHPGFYNGGGSWEDRPESMCYTEPENRVKYWAGGVSGGSLRSYWRAMNFMKNIIDIDEKNGIMPVWHDESAWNFFLSFVKPTVELSPSYCMPEQQHLRKEWGIDNFRPIILALDKNHKAIRE